MNRELIEGIEENVCSSDNEEEISEQGLDTHIHYPSYQSEQEEADIQVETSENISILGDDGDRNNDSLFSEETLNPLHHLFDLITIDYFNDQSNLFDSNSFGVNEDFGEVLLVGEDIMCSN